MSQYYEPYRQFQMDYPWVVVFPILLMIGTVLVGIFVPIFRKVPMSLLVLLMFVLCFSYLISMSCSALVDEVEGPVVPLAVVSTVGVTFLLTIYAFLCKGNFLIWIGIIIVCGATAGIVGIIAIFSRIPALTIVFCALAIAVFGVYLVIITKLIIGG
jgi:FtsH-binding integral membrane protein